MLCLIPLNFAVLNNDHAAPKKTRIKSLFVLKQMIANKPKINRVVASQLADLIEKYAIQYKMDPHRAAAIAMQESGYRNVISVNKDQTIDVGYFQINSNTAKAYKLSIEKLKTDMEYAVEAYFIVMQDKKKICSKRKDAWACYHSKNPILKAKYVKLVNRYYKNAKDGMTLNEQKIASL